MHVRREKLGAHAFVEVIAIDAQQTASRVISLPEPEMTFRDLRLAESFDGQKHFTEQKQVSVLKAGEKIMLVEAMKTFNEIVATKGGTVTAILVEDGQPVEYGQALMIIE